MSDLFTAGFVRWDERSPFTIHFEVTQRTKAIGPFATAFAPTTHAVPNHAIRLDQGGRKFCYKRRRQANYPKSRALFVGSDLLMHECYVSEASPEQLYHCDLPTVRSLEGVARTWPVSHSRQASAQRCGRRSSGNRTCSFRKPA